MNAREIAFWIVAVISVASAVMVVAHRNAVRSALFLIINFVCLAFLYLTLNAQLLAALQVLVYAGAIMVLFLFVIMLLNLGGEQKLKDPLGGQTGAAVLLGLFLVAGLFAAVFSARTLSGNALPPATPLATPPGDQVSAIGAA